MSPSGECKEGEMMATLKELGLKYSSDKYHWHSYLTSGKYDELFAGMNVRRLLEIGIGFASLMQPFLPKGVEYCHGSSLKMWEEYFPEAQIFACDIREDALVNEGRIRSVTCDQGNAADLLGMNDHFGGNWSVIVDDGSHQYEHQRITLATLLPTLTVGALWITEDCWPENGNKLAEEFGGEFWQGEKGRDDGLVIFRR